MLYIFPLFSGLCPCNFGHKLLRFLHCLPIKFSKILIYFCLCFVKWKGFPYNIFMYIISLTILFCICWMKAEVCNFCSTSSSNKTALIIITTFYQISQIVRQIDWLIQCCCVGTVSRNDVIAAQRCRCYIFGEFNLPLAYLLIFIWILNKSYFNIEKNYTLQL